MGRFGCGRACRPGARLARDDQAREQRSRILALPGALRSLGDVFVEAGELLATAKGEAKSVADRRDGAELEELKTALGAGGTGKGAVGAARGTAGVVKDLERRQKSRATRTERDVLDRALVDLSGFYRDVIARGLGATVALNNPDLERDVDSRRHSIRRYRRPAPPRRDFGLPGSDRGERQTADRRRGDDDEALPLLTRSLFSRADQLRLR